MTDHDLPSIQHQRGGFTAIAECYPVGPNRQRSNAIRLAEGAQPLLTTPDTTYISRRPLKKLLVPITLQI